MSEKNKPNELYLTRVYDAPVKLVWDAWTDPKKAAKWWGPRGFTITTHSKDLKVGGHWHYTMHGPDGVDYPNKTVYFEVEKYARLVYDHGANDNQPPLFRVTVNFSESNGKTTMDMTMTLASEEAAKQIEKFIKIAGGNSTWDRLAEYLDKEESGKDNFVINRTFKAPIATMFEMVTNPKHFSQWLAPTGMTMEYLKSDIKKDGTTIFLMTDGKDFTLHNRQKYLEIQKPNKVSYTQEFCDEKGNLAPNIFSEIWPTTLLVTILLAEENPTQTRLTVTMEAVGDVTKEELQAFINERANMTQGWTGSFDKLEEYVTKI